MEPKNPHSIKTSIVKILNLVPECNALFTDPFSHSKSGILITSRFINGNRARILADTRYEISYFSEALCEQCKICKNITSYHAFMADKAQQCVEATEKPKLIQLKYYTDTLHFTIRPLNLDVILEKNSCVEHQA